MVSPGRRVVGKERILRFLLSVLYFCLSGGLYRSVLLCLGLQVSIGSPEKMEPITKVSHIPSSRWALVCSLCNEKFGASIQVISSVRTV